MHLSALILCCLAPVQPQDTLSHVATTLGAE